MQHRCFAIGKNRGKRMRAAIAQRRCDQLYMHGYTGCSVTTDNIQPLPGLDCASVLQAASSFCARVAYGQRRDEDGFVLTT